MNNTKQENFKRIATNRVNKIIDLISKLQNLSNSSFYEYTDEQINRNLPIWMTYEPGSTFKNVTPLFSNFILKL